MAQKIQVSTTGPLGLAFLVETSESAITGAADKILTEYQTLKYCQYSKKTGAGDNTNKTRYVVSTPNAGVARSIRGAMLILDNSVKLA